MKNLAALLAIFLVIGLFSGCEKDNFTDASAADGTTAITAEDLAEIENAVKQSETSEKMLETKQAPSLEQIIAKAGEAQSAGPSLRSTIAPILPNIVPQINCGDVLSGNNFNTGNDYTGSLYQRGCLSNYYPFDAPDAEYILTLQPNPNR